MLSIKSRILLFLFGCIPTRLLFIILAKDINVKYLPYLGYIGLLPAIGFSYLYLTGSRKSGFEAGGKIWWNSLRPLHSILWMLFAYSSILKNKNSWKILALDLIIGIFAFLTHHFLDSESERN